MEILKCYCCGGSSFELSATYPPIFLRPKETSFLTLKRGAQMAAKVCRACGAVTLTADKNKTSKLQKKPKSRQLFMFFFVIIMITLVAYTEYQVNFLEKALIERHDQMEKKDAEIMRLKKDLAAVSSLKPRNKEK